jgi:hypothetical protein
MTVQEACEAANLTSYQMRSSFGEHTWRTRPTHVARRGSLLDPTRPRAHGLSARVPRQNLRPDHRHPVRSRTRHVLGRSQQPRRGLRHRLVTRPGSGWIVQAAEQDGLRVATEFEGNKVFPVPLVQLHGMGIAGEPRRSQLPTRTSLSTCKNQSSSASENSSRQTPAWWRGDRISLSQASSCRRDSSFWARQGFLDQALIRGRLRGIAGGIELMVAGRDAWKSRAPRAGAGIRARRARGQTAPGFG